MKVNVYDSKAVKTTKELKIIKQKAVSESTFLQYVRVFLNNQRKGQGASKTRAEVRGGGRKPWRQKGTGRARVGSIRSPLWVGGGAAHGPKTASTWRLRLNKSTKKSVFNTLLVDHIKEGTLDIFKNNYKKPNSKLFKSLIDKIYGEQVKKVLLVQDSEKELALSARNLKNVNLADISNLSSMHLAKANKVLLTEKALKKLEERL